MSSERTQKLITMANQIAMFFDSQTGSDPVENVADHLRDFWDPRMRQQLKQYVEDSGQGLIPTAAKAAQLL